MRVTKGGFIIPNDDGKEIGMRTRWCQVEIIGEGIDFLSKGEWVLMPHGRWTNSFHVETEDGEKKVWMIDINDILIIADENPIETEQYSL